MDKKTNIKAWPRHTIQALWAAFTNSHVAGFVTGKIYTGKVVRILQFGAFVDLGFGKEGMIHISKLSNTRVEKVEDVVNIGDTVEVECIKINDGKVDFKLIGKYSK